MKNQSQVMNYAEKDSVRTKTIEDLEVYDIEEIISLLVDSQNLDTDTHENVFISYLSRVVTEKRPIELVAIDFTSINGHFPAILKKEGNIDSVEYYCNVITTRHSTRNLQQISELFPQNSEVRVRLHTMSEDYN